MHILDLLLGRRLANRESEGRRIGVVDAVPAMGLDAIASSAYGPEAAFAVLLPLGAAGIGWIGWIMAPIVARENLGTNSALLAAAALMIDYVLNASVAISAGVGALVSALPALHPHMLLLCLALLAAITLVNLRGTHEAGRLFALPTYLFLACFAALIALGMRAALAASGHPHAQVAPAPLPPATQAASTWLLLRAFASGCTAMTGIEAVGNGMGALREPVVRTGHRTLAAIVFALAALLAGIAWLAHAYGIGAMDQTRAGYRSVLAQLAAAVVGEGPFYYVAIGALLCVLALSANTSFVAFPRLCRMLATDGFLPKPFANAGRRLVFSVGIAYLAACAGVLLVVFGGITEHLIPLFAIGAFLTFTLSQAGMVVHWRRVLRGCSAGERRRHRIDLAINAVGALASAAAALVMAVGKFREGAWITLLVIPCVIALLKTIRAYYDELDARMRTPGPLDLAAARPPMVLVVMEEWNRLADRAISLALSLSPDVIGVHLVRLEGPDSEERHRELRHTWHDDVELPARAAGFAPPSLRILEAQYRTLHEPLLKLAQALAAEHPDRRIAVLVPELVKQRWYQHVLHGRRARRLRAMLLRYGGSRLTVISAPWYLDRTEAPPDAERATEKLK